MRDWGLCNRLGPRDFPVTRWWWLVGGKKGNGGVVERDKGMVDWMTAAQQVE